MDRTDARLLLALIEEPRAAVLAIAQRLALSRNTVATRLARFDHAGVLMSLERCIDPAAFGYPLRAYVTVIVEQRRLDEVAASLSRIPEVLEIAGVSGASDLLVQVAARDADDLYRSAGQLLATGGVERTETALVMRELLPYRVRPLVHRAARA